MNEYRYELSARAKKVLKKVRDKALVRKYQETMRDISKNPFEGDQKVEDLDGLFTVG